MTRPTILIDDCPFLRRVAVLQGEDLLAYGEDNMLLDLPRPGAVVVARVEQLFPDHGQASVDCGGIAGSLRLGRKPYPAPGDLVLATVTAEPREQKPLQLRQGVFIEETYLLAESGPAGLRLSRGLREAGFTSPKETTPRHQITLRSAAVKCSAETLRDMIAAAEARIDTFLADQPTAPGMLANGPDALAVAQAAFPDATCSNTPDAVAWDEAGVDAALVEALQPTLVLPAGARLHIHTPPGAAVIDCDSAAGGLAPLALAKLMVPVIAREMVLRRISGPVVVDFPRLDGKGQRQIDALMHDAVADDPQRPQCHGFTKGGLYTLTRPWRGQPLVALLAPSGMRHGLMALRLVHAARLGRDLAPVIRLPETGYIWLEGEGSAARDQVLEGLAIRPQFRSDEHVIQPVLDARSTS